MPLGKVIKEIQGSAGCDLDILVVEDSQTYAAWLTGLLRKEGSQRGRGMRVVEVQTLADAHGILASRRIDAVLLDLNLPDSTGLDTVVAVTTSCPNIPIVVVSGLNDEDIAIQALSKGAQEYIFKGREREGSIFRTMCRSMERKNVEIQLALAQQQAMHNERLAAIGLIASGVAHEYNNIGAVILGNVELLLGHAELPTALRPRAERIREAADRAAAVTQSLLSFVRGFREAEHTVVMQEVVNTTWSLAESTLTRHGVLGSMNLAAQPLPVRGNGSILGQVLLNLIINACHAMDGEPQRNLHIALQMDSNGAGVVLTVSDTGRGIAPENLDRIFLPFFTTKAGKGTAISGTGLGLAVCEAFIRQHGGNIRAESVQGHGSTFQVWLPLTAQGTATNNKQEILPPMALEAEGRRALIIDDEDGVRELFDIALRDLGMITTLTSSLKGLLPLDPSALPDLVLTDWQLPDGSGRCIVEHVLKIPSERRPAVLVGSGNLSESDERWLSGLQNVSIINKPVALRELQVIVRRALAQKTGRII